MTFMEAFQNVLPELTSECKNGRELWDVLRRNNGVTRQGCPGRFLNHIPLEPYCAGISCGWCYESEILPEDFEKLYFQKAHNDLIPDSIKNIPLAELFGQSSSISDDDLVALLQGGK